MRSPVVLLLTSLLVACGGGSGSRLSTTPFLAQTTTAPAPIPATVAEYQNPLQVTAPDGSQVASCPDPSIIQGQAADDHSWYLYCTNERFADYGYVHLLPIFKSEDLVHWSYISDVFAVTPSWVATDGGLWAPDIRFFNGQYYLYYSVSDTKQGGAAIFVATSNTPSGPWTGHPTPVVEPGPAPCCGGLRATIDPAIVDDGAQKYIFYGSFNGGISARALSPDGMSTSRSSQVQITTPDRYEASYIVKHDDFYYLMVSAGDCCAGELSGYGVFVARSKNPLGPYVDRDGSSLLDPRVGGTPVLSMNGNRWVGPGHNAVFTDAAGQDWMVYHAVDVNHPYFAGSWTRRPVMMDPMNWVDEWPVVRNGNGPSDFLSAGPALSASQTGLYQTPLAIFDSPATQLPEFSDDFDESTMSSQWSWLRPPSKASYGIGDGALRFDTQSGDLYIGHHDASVLLESEPPGDYIVEIKISMTEPAVGRFNFAQAGLVIYKDDDNYIKLVTSSINSTRQIEFAKQYNSGVGSPTQYGSSFLTSPADSTYLRIAKHGFEADETYTAYSSHDGVKWYKGPTWRHQLGSGAKIGLVSMSRSGFSTFFDYVRVYSIAN